ncbi:Retinoic acid induced 16-like protein [Sarcoptes scabiei]|uniref:Retinoic acid induced 16-like protein n=1 Tax=Sarcoptes scabiei TaxID=52283 RepID=A0A132ABT7_SARSC|nr:Retinoic acid induced 16-like protein [Sarcoptes scabiei]
MFQLISNSSLAEVLAPPLSKLEELIFQWDSFTMFFKQKSISNGSSKQQKLRYPKMQIESTKLDQILTKIADLVVTEQIDFVQKKKDQSSCVAPTMEFILQNDILETLCSIGLADCPVGIYPHVLLFFTRLLSDSKLTLIPYRSVHSSLNRIIVHYSAIPQSIKPEEIESINCLSPTELEQSAVSKSVRKYLCFIKWYIFFDMIINHLQDDSMILIDSLLKDFRIKFLESTLLPDLSGEGFQNKADSIESSVLATTLLSNCLRNTESSKIFNKISDFLILKCDEPNVIDSTPSSNPLESKEGSLKGILLQRIQICSITEANRLNSSREIVLLSATLQLFDDILTRVSQKIVEDLLLTSCTLQENQKQVNNLFNYDDQPVESAIQSKFNSLVVLDQMIAVANELCTLKEIDKISSLPIEHLDYILILFTSLIPDELKCDARNERRELEVYLKEIVQAFNHFMKNYYRTKATSKSQISHLKIKSTCDRENFIDILIDNLTRWPLLTNEIKLQIFSILAKISLIPERIINEKLLDPTYCSQDEQHTTLFSVLHRLVCDLQVSVRGIDHLGKKLHQTKLKLLYDEVNELENDTEQSKESYEQVKTLEDIILLEEFIKELSAIVYAKNYILKLCNEKNQSNEKCDLNGNQN